MGNKSLYAAALDSELHHSDSLDKFCKLFNNIADAFDWMKQEHTDEEIAGILAKLGYDIILPKPADKPAKTQDNNVSKKVSKQQRLLSPKEAATYLGTSISSLNKWRNHDGRDLPFVKCGRFIRYRKEDLDSWVQMHVVMSENNETYICKAG